jgi:hypothetical protein
MSAPTILFICGSVNQTEQMHAVSRALGPHKARFSPYFGDLHVKFARAIGALEATIAGKKRRGWCLDYLRKHGLTIDEDGLAGDYDLVVTCSDLILPKIAREKPLVAVQEGIFDPDNWMSDLWRKLRFLPMWLAGTSLTGESHVYERYCVASPGYKDRLIAMGADPSAVVVTGIPNFDDCASFHDNDFPLEKFVLVCTSDARETFKDDDRAALVRRAQRIAAGRPLVFKLHPNEHAERSTAEIKAVAPEAIVYASGKAEHMIAKCDVLITQWSSTAFVGLALGKEVHSNFPREELERLRPLQNGGTSAERIARVVEEVHAELRGVKRSRFPSRAKGRTTPQLPLPSREPHALPASASSRRNLSGESLFP